jgi:hypothetical protein
MRKSIKFGPLRFTFTNSTVSASVGSPLGRISLNTKGQLRNTARIPGTGLFNTEVTNLNGEKPRRTRASNAGLGPNQFVVSNYSGSRSDFPAKGWFQDPLGGEKLRLWDGVHWQTDVRDATPNDTNTSLSQFPQEGWYPDPDGSPKECYWMQNQWSTHFREPGEVVDLIGTLPDPDAKRKKMLGRASYVIIAIAVVYQGAQVAKTNPWFLAFPYSLLSLLGLIYFLFGLYKGFTGRETYLYLKPGKAMGWLLCVVGIAMVEIGMLILPNA